MVSILKCPKCNKYGISEQCNCGGKKIRVKPAKYSPDDKYGKYRRMAKEQE